MPEDEQTIAEEITELVTDAVRNEVDRIPAVVFPDVQKVEVTNQIEPVINVNVPDVHVPEIKIPTINVPKSEVFVSFDELKLPDTKESEAILNEIKKLLENAPIVSHKDIIEALEDLGENLADAYKKVKVVGGGSGGIGSYIYNSQSVAINPATEEKQDAIIANQTINTVSTANGTTSLLAAGATYTGTWEDVSRHPSMVLAVKTDQNGTYTIQFSPDGVNVDATITRYYRTNQIEVPHRFTVTRQYARVTFTNTSAVDQTYLRFQVLLCAQTDLNTPLDSTMSQDFDAIAVRPTDYKHEVALGRRQGATLWNKFGYNADIDIGTEVIASWGGTFTPMTTARTLSVVSTDADDNGVTPDTGANSVIIYGIDANREAQTVVVTLNGTTPVVTTETWLGVNRMAIYVSGTSKVNEGTITATATTDLTIQAQIPIGEGTSQQCIFFIQEGHQALAEWLTVTSLKQSGASPVVTVKAWVYSAISGSKYEVARISLDTAVENHVDLKPPVPFPITESSVFWLEGTTNKADTVVNARFSLIEVRDVDA